LEETTSRKQPPRYVHEKYREHEPVRNSGGHLPPARIFALGARRGALGKIFGNFRRAGLRLRTLSKAEDRLSAILVTLDKRQPSNDYH